MIAAILRNARGRDDGVVAKDAAEIVLVGKDLFLQRQEDAGRIDQIDQRQAIREGDPLRPQHLLGGRRERTRRLSPWRRWRRSCAAGRRSCRSPSPLPPPARRPNRHTCRRRPTGRVPTARSASISFAIRSRAVSRCLPCCRSIAACPPPSRNFSSWRRSSASRMGSESGVLTAQRSCGHYFLDQAPQDRPLSGHSQNEKENRSQSEISRHFPTRIHPSPDFAIQQLLAPLSLLGKRSEVPALMAQRLRSVTPVGLRRLASPAGRKHV